MIVLKDDFDIIRLNKKAWDNTTEIYNGEFHVKNHFLLDITVKSSLKENIFWIWDQEQDYHMLNY